MGIKTNLLDYLIEHSDTYTSNYIELMRTVLGTKIHHYGENFINPDENRKKKVNNVIRSYAEFLATKLFGKTEKNKRKILSSTDSIWNKHINDLGFDVQSPPWNLRRDFKMECSCELYLLVKKIKFHFENSPFNYLISNTFLALLDKYCILFKDFCISNSYEALIVSQYNGFFERVAINIFKELDKPTIYWHHGGIPSLYDCSFDNRTDYIILFGQKQVDAYIKMGYNSSIILASGHPIYNIQPKYLKFELDKILVLNKNPSGCDPLEKTHLENRGNSIMYLYSVQKVLQFFGVKQVTLRIHPSGNYNWYKKHIDNLFFKEDKLNLVQSLKKATLVIGPTSTTLIDALYHCVNYVVYEPTINNLTVMGRPVTPPLDGLDKRIPIARSEDELTKIIQEKKYISTDVYGEFVKTPMDISFLTKII
jgi:hypothetical protein